MNGDGQRLLSEFEGAAEMRELRQRLAYKLAEAADLLGIAKRSVRDLMDTGKLGYVRMAGGQRIIPHAALIAYLEPEKSTRTSKKSRRPKVRRSKPTAANQQS